MATPGRTRTGRVKDRRPLRFESLQGIVDDVLAIDGDRVRTTGNWTAPQIVQHVAKLINFSIDGFPARASIGLRFLGRRIRRRALTKPWKPGLNFPRRFSFLEPDDKITWDDAVTFLRESVGRLQYEKMEAASPVLGPLSPDEWELVHCRHAEMHFSFMHPLP